MIDNINNKIIIKGAKEHNLKNIDLELPRDKLIVFTGVSGSGKSSLAFDTIYADGQRRYVESLSSYARQFLGQMNKPDVESIEGLSPAISIQQKTTSKNPRSTVGTVTEIYDYLRLLYASIGVPHCPICQKEIKSQSIDQMIDSIMTIPERTRFQILAPVARAQKGTHKSLLESMRKQGYIRVRVDGKIYDLSEQMSEGISLEKNKKHNIEVIVDRLVMKNEIRPRLTDSVETALKLSGGLVIVDIINNNRDDRQEKDVESKIESKSENKFNKFENQELLFSQNYTCVDHPDVNIPELSPRMFSFNNPFGACSTCMGIGFFRKIDKNNIVPDPNLTINQGAIKASGWNFAEGGIAKMYFDGLAEKYGFSLDVPFKDLSDEVKDVIFYGTGEEKIKLVWNFKFREGTTYG